MEIYLSRSLQVAVQGCYHQWVIEYTFVVGCIDVGETVSYSRGIAAYGRAWDVFFSDVDTVWLFNNYPNPLILLRL
jgi:hypothetical protein